MTTRTCTLCGIKGCKKTIKSGFPIIGNNSHPAHTWVCTSYRYCRRRIAMQEELKRPDVIRQQKERRAAIELIRRACRRRIHAIEQRLMEEARLIEEAQRLQRIRDEETITKRIVDLAPSRVLMLKELRLSRFTGIRSVTEQKAILINALELFEEESNPNSERVRVVGMAFKRVYDSLSL